MQAVKSHPKVPPPFSKAMAGRILKRDGNRCVICGLGEKDGVELRAAKILLGESDSKLTLESGLTLCEMHYRLQELVGLASAGDAAIADLYTEAASRGTEFLMKFSEAMAVRKPAAVVRKNGSGEKAAKKSNRPEAAQPTIAYGSREKYFSESNLLEKSALDRSAFPRNSFDLIVTSPPYNVGLEYGDETNDGGIYKDYLAFTKQWLSNCYAWSRKGGRFCLNIPLDKNKEGKQSVGADITTIAKRVGWNYHATVIWNEGNISRRTAWGSWLSASAPHVIAPVELIVILHKGDWKRIGKGRETGISRDEFMEWTNGVWTFNGESGKRIGHPAPFPLDLPRRCIKLFSFVDDSVLDPFAGSGTTLIEAINNRRYAFGLEIEADYRKLARARIMRECF